MTQRGANEEEADEGTTTSNGKGSNGKNKVKVGSYKKSDGTKVSDYQRALPGRAANAVDAKKRSASDQEEEEGNDAPPKDPRGEEPEMKRIQQMSVEEYLEMALQDQEKAINTLVTGHKLDEALVAQDAHTNAAIADAPVEEKGPAGFDDFLAQLQAEAESRGLMGSDVVQSIVTNAMNRRYDDDEPGAWGKGSLVPHLQMAGLYDTALTVQSMQFKF
jgi:hypothetical protein